MMDGSGSPRVYLIYSIIHSSTERRVNAYCAPGESREQTMISEPFLCCFYNDKYNYNFIMAAMSVSVCETQSNFSYFFYQNESK